MFWFDGVEDILEKHFEKHILFSSKHNLEYKWKYKWKYKYDVIIKRFGVKCRKCSVF